MNYRKIVATLIIAGALAGCSQSETSDAEALLKANPPPAEAKETGTDQDGVEAKEIVIQGDNKLMSAEFDQPTCDRMTEAMIRWNTDTVQEGFDSAELWVGDKDRKIVAAAGRNDSFKIPGWMAPGTVLTLRTPKGTTELDRLVVPGTPCPKAP